MPILKTNLQSKLDRKAIDEANRHKRLIEKVETSIQLKQTRPNKFCNGCGMKYHQHTDAEFIECHAEELRIRAQMVREKARMKLSAQKVLSARKKGIITRILHGV